MIPFVALGALLTLVALGFVLWPFWRARAAADERKLSRRAENVAIYRQRVEELRAEQAAGRLASEDVDGLVEELSAALLEDVPDEALASRDAEPGTRRAWAPLVLACLVPVAVLALYLRLGAGPEFQLAGAADLLRSPVDQPAALAELIARLERQVERRPGDADSLFLLGHARMRERNFEAAAASFARVVALAGADPNTLVSLIQARFLADGGRMSEENRRRAEDVLKAAPHQPLVLEMLALDATAAGDPGRAVGYLQRALAGAAPAEAAGLREELARARQAAGLGPGPSIEVTVDGLATTAEPQPDAVLYVLARRQGERMPRMVVRRSVGAADRFVVRLDGGSIMGEQAPLRAGETLEVVARLSPSGDVRGGPGTLEAVSEPITLTDGPVEVALSLREAPTLGQAPTLATTPRPAPSESTPSKPIEAGLPSAQVTVQLTATPGLQAPPDARVFVIARPLTGPPMPIAVRALTFADLPATIELTDRDAMAPGRTISRFQEVAVLARLSRSGAPTRQPGDAESEVVRVQPADRPAVNLVLR